MEVKRFAFAFAVVLSMAITPAAYARDPGWYLGGSDGQSNYSSFNGQCRFCDSGSTNATGWSVMGGYRFNPYFALEAQRFGMGTVNASGSFFDVGFGIGIQENAQFSLAGYGIDAVGNYPIDQIGNVPVNGRVALFAKLGLVRSRVDASTTGFDDTSEPGLPPTTVSLDSIESATKTGPELGVGAEIALSEHWSMRIGYTQIHDVGDTATGTGNVYFTYLSALLYF